MSFNMSLRKEMVMATICLARLPDMSLMKGSRGDGAEGKKILVAGH